MNILIVDDTEDGRQPLAEALREFGGHSVHEAGTVARAKEYISSLPELDWVITDFNLDRGNFGLEVLQHLHDSRPKCKGALTSGLLRPEPRKQAEGLGYHTFTKAAYLVFFLKHGLIHAPPPEPVGE